MEPAALELCISVAGEAGRPSRRSGLSSSTRNPLFLLPSFKNLQVFRIIAFSTGLQLWTKYISGDAGTSSAHSRVRARGARRRAGLQDCSKIQPCNAAKCLALSVLYSPLLLEKSIISPRPEVIKFLWLLCSVISLSYLMKNYLLVIANWNKFRRPT